MTLFFQCILHYVVLHRWAHTSVDISDAGICNQCKDLCLLIGFNGTSSPGHHNLLAAFTAAALGCIVCIHLPQSLDVKPVKRNFHSFHFTYSKPSGSDLTRQHLKMILCTCPLQSTGPVRQVGCSRRQLYAFHLALKIEQFAAEWRLCQPPLPPNVKGDTNREICCWQLDTQRLGQVSQQKQCR